MSSQSFEGSYTADLAFAFDEKLNKTIDTHADQYRSEQIRSQVVTIGRTELSLPPVLHLKSDNRQDRSAVVLLPSATCLNRDNVLLQMTMLQGALADSPQVFAFPHHSRSYDLMIRDTYAGNCLDYLKSRDLKQIDIVAMETSSRAGALMADIGVVRRGIEARSLTIIEPPNVAERDPYKLTQEFTDFPTVKAMKRVFDDYGLGNYRAKFPQKGRLMRNEAKRYSRSAALTLGHLCLDDMATAFLKELSDDTIGQDMEMVDPSCKKVVVRGANSSVCPSFGSVEDRTVGSKLEIREMGREVLTPIIVTQIVRSVLEQQ